jgi:hypothetical protein
MKMVFKVVFKNASLLVVSDFLLLIANILLKSLFSIAEEEYVAM